MFDKTKHEKEGAPTALNFENEAREKELEIIRNKMHRDFKKKVLTKVILLLSHNCIVNLRYRFRRKIENQ